jgi:hypothetical protein
MAYLVARNEYGKHYQETDKPHLLAMQTALFSFVFFFLASLLIAYVLRANL